MKTPRPLMHDLKRYLRGAEVDVADRDVAALLLEGWELLEIESASEPMEDSEDDS